jgi:hypothetical protein
VKENAYPQSRNVLLLELEHSFHFLVLDWKISSTLFTTQKGLLKTHFKQFLMYFSAKKLLLRVSHIFQLNSKEHESSPMLLRQARP